MLAVYTPKQQHILPPFTASAFNSQCSNRRKQLDQVRGCPQPGSHSGVTLIEMMVAISMLSVLMMLSGMTFHLLMRSEKLVSQSFITERTISQLAVDFREDVHRAKSGTLTASEEQTDRGLDLDLANGTHARYQIDKNQITRLLVRDNTTIAREEFRLPDCQIRLLPKADSEPSRQGLIIDRPGPMLTRNAHAPRPMRSLTIEAYLNRWPRPLINSKSEPGDDSEQSNQDGVQP